MSIDAVAWAFQQDVKPSSAKFVLVAMAHCVRRGDTTCFPSMAYLETATGQDRKTVLENVKRLREAGCLTDTGERKGRTGQVVVYALNCAEFGTVEASQDRASSEAERVPKFPGNSPKFPAKGSRNSAPTVPNLGHGTLPTGKGTGDYPPGGEAPSAARPDGRGGELPAYIDAQAWQALLRSRRRVKDGDVERWLQQAANLHEQGRDVAAAVRQLTLQTGWRELSPADVAKPPKTSRHAGLKDRWEVTNGRQVA